MLHERGLALCTSNEVYILHYCRIPMIVLQFGQLEAFLVNIHHIQCQDIVQFYQNRDTEDVFSHLLTALDSDFWQDSAIIPVHSAILLVFVWEQRHSSGSIHGKLSRPIPNEASGFLHDVF